MIDTHCHLTFPDLASQTQAVLDRARQDGVDRVITVGTTPDDSTAGAALAAAHTNIYATAGLHPHYAERCPDLHALTTTLRALIENPRVVALGEMGLDAHYPDPPMPAQRQAFQTQLDLAATLTAPIIIHNRECTADTLAMLRDSAIPARRFVFHCFTGTGDELDAILDFGAMVSLTGVVTFKNSQPLRDASTRIPLDRLMIETDAPYLTPAPHRKVRPNEPRFVADVARCLAKTRDMSLKDFTRAVDANAERFFGLASE